LNTLDLIDIEHHPVAELFKKLGVCPSAVVNALTTARYIQRLLYRIISVRAKETYPGVTQLKVIESQQKDFGDLSISARPWPVGDHIA